MSTPFYRHPLFAFIKSDGSHALASRMYVYLAGFIAVFLLSANVPPVVFGEYSLYQSALELGLIVATMGSSIVFSRSATAIPTAIFEGDLLHTLKIGIPAAAVLLATMLWAQGLAPFSTSGLCVLLALGFFAFNGLRLAYRRGWGQAGLLNIESGIRATVLILGIAASLWYGGGLRVEYLLQVNLGAIVLITLAILFSDRHCAPPPAGPHALKLPTQLAATGYSLMTFLLRKADLLIVAFLMPLAYVGAFKLAFLLAEAPSQFVIAYLYTNTSSMVAARRPGYQPAKIELARNCLLLGLFLFAGLYLTLHFGGSLLKFSDEARSIFLCMLPYYLLRTYTVHHEMLLQFNTRLRNLGSWASAEVVLKLASYAAVAWAFPGRPHYVFFIMAFSEFISYELRARAVLGYLPILRVLRSMRQFQS